VPLAWLLRLILLVGGTVMASLACAQCAGFADVAPGAFCTNVTWMKNRQVTLGCTPAGTMYCPNNGVSRLAMAAFMNRVGNVLTPNVLQVDDVGASLPISNQPQFVCPTALLPAVNYMRKMHVNLTLSYELTGAQDVLIGLGHSTNGAPFVVNSQTSTFGTTGNRLHHHYASPVTEDLPPGATYRFAIAVTRAGTNTNSIGAFTCQMQAIVLNASE
jgi:hypothetical protein